MDEAERDQRSNTLAYDREMERRERRVAENKLKQKGYGEIVQKSSPSIIDEENAQLKRDRTRAEYIKRKLNEKEAEVYQKKNVLDTTHPLKREVALKDLKKKIQNDPKQFAETGGKYEGLKKALMGSPLVGARMEAGMNIYDKLSESDFGGAVREGVEQLANEGMNLVARNPVVQMLRSPSVEASMIPDRELQDEMAQEEARQKATRFGGLAQRLMKREI